MHRTGLRTLAVFIAFAALTTGSCEYEPLASLRPTTVTTTTIRRISIGGSVIFESVGQTGQFTATAFFTDGTSKDVTADGQWQSSDTGVATISETGEARIVGFGTCIISFEYEKQLASVNLRSGSPATITLSGRVREPGSGGLVGVRVVETSSGRSAVTTGFGQFAITDVPRGQLRLKVEKDGYETRELDTTEQEGIDLPIQRVVRLNAGETVKPADLAPNDVPYTIRNDECICRLIRVSVSRAGTLGVRVRWPRMGTALHLFAEGKSVSGEDEVSVEIPATTAREVVMFFGRVTQPSQPARDYVAFTFETTFR